MEAVSVSPKYQVVIPKEIREKMQIEPGEKMVMIPCGDRIEMVRQREMSELRGSLEGMDTEVERAREERL